MRKNWLAASWLHRFRAEPLVPDDAFQTPSEPDPGHWRQFPTSWRTGPSAVPGAEARAAELSATLTHAVTDLPVPWQRVLAASGLGDDRQESADVALTAAQRRDILARARAAVRDRLDRTLMRGPR